VKRKPHVDETVESRYDHLGTLIYNIGVHPVSGRVYAPNTDALNHIRSEPNLRGQFARTRIALDEQNEPLYVMNRFTNSIDVVETDTRMVASTVTLFDPSPDVIRNGRRFLYDARLSSGHGDLACASCHAGGGNFDNIAWDLATRTVHPNHRLPGSLTRS
jgi:cytochrome c peroxidase